MRLRFVEEYNPVTDLTIWSVERKYFAGWLYVSGTLTSDEDKARLIWERCKKLKSVAVIKRVLETI